MFYRKFAPGTQLDVQFLESQVYSNSRKFEIISSLETEEHDYLSLAVCRNPIEKLLSVYQVLKDPRVGRNIYVMAIVKRVLLMLISLRFYIKANPEVVDPEKYPGRRDFLIPRRWEEYLDLIAENDLNYLGLLYPFHLRCDPCRYNYDAIIRMETFEEDIK